MQDATHKKEHVLIATAKTFPRATESDLAPAGHRYAPEIGAWHRDGDPEQLWVGSPGRRPPQTKKHDVETGEDQKGA